MAKISIFGIIKRRWWMRLAAATTCFALMVVFFGSNLLSVPAAKADNGIVVTTTKAINVTSSSAELWGSLDQIGATEIVNREGFRYGTTNPPPNTPWVYFQSYPLVNLPLGSFSQTVYGLQPDTVYYFGAIAGDTQDQKAFGAVLSFRTLPASTQPTVTTIAATGIGNKTAVIWGNIGSNGTSTSISQKCFNWGPSIGVNRTVSGYSSTCDTDSTGADFSFGLSELLSGTEYGFQAWASGSDGAGYGKWEYFTTAGSKPLNAQPVVHTYPDFAVGADWAQPIGNITSAGLIGGYTGTITSRCFQWGREDGSGGTRVNCDSVNSTGTYSLKLSNLDPTTRYKVRAYVMSTAQSQPALGEEFTFTTVPPPSDTTVSKELVAVARNDVADNTFDPYAPQPKDTLKVTIHLGAFTTKLSKLEDKYPTLSSGGTSYICKFVKTGTGVSPPVLNDSTLISSSQYSDNGSGIVFTELVPGTYSNQDISYYCKVQ